LLSFDFPEDLSGKTVLDIGTTNGGMAFEAERRGAARVVAVDILDADWFGFRALQELFGSSAQHVQASVYELAEVLAEEFDIVVFTGVLYHLRHPLLALDAVRRVARDVVYLETAVSDAQDPPGEPTARFHRLDDLGQDGSNWWSPTTTALDAWCRSAGFDVERTVPVPPGQLPTRCLATLRVAPGPPEYVRISYAVPLAVAPRIVPSTPPLPIPPLEMRVLVGPTEPAAFDNPDRTLVIPGVDASHFDAVFDWGCGCGRVARQLIQQVPRPRRYLGIDLHRGMIKWCQRNLAPAAPEFVCHHHDVFELDFNPGTDKPRWLPFPCEDGAFSLAIAWSVFTHVNEEQATRYLHEMRRILRPNGVLFSTWFLFDKTEFPMMGDSQNALFVNDVNPTGAVIFDKNWLRSTARAAGLTLYAATARDTWLPLDRLLHADRIRPPGDRPPGRRRETRTASATNRRRTTPRDRSHLNPARPPVLVWWPMHFHRAPTDRLIGSARRREHLARFPARREP
jgi:SAM-dependent methyltransferase